MWNRKCSFCELNIELPEKQNRNKTIVHNKLCYKPIELIGVECNRVAHHGVRAVLLVLFWELLLSKLESGARDKNGRFSLPKKTKPKTSEVHARASPTARVRRTYPLHSLVVVVLVNPPLSKYFQWCLQDIAHVVTWIIIFQQCLTLQGLQGAAPVPTSCPCCFVLYCAYMRPRSLSFLSALVCDLLPRPLFIGSPKAHCQKSISVTILTGTACRTLGLFGAFPTLVGGHHWSLGATFLGS